MGHRLQHWHDRLVEHLEDRKWTEEDKQHFLHMVGRSALMTSEGALSILEFQQATDERIKAEKRFDEAFVPGIPLDFFEQRFNFPEPLSYDDMGNYHNPDGES